MDIVAEIIKVVISTGLVAIIVKFFLDRKLEREQDNLRHVNEIEQEKNRAAFAIEIERARASYTGLFEKRLETIEMCHRLLVELHEALGKYTRIIEHEKDGPREARHRAVLEKAKEFREFYLPNRLYLTRELEEIVDAFFKDISDVVISFMQEVEGKEFNMEATRRWISLSDTVEKDILKTLKELRNAMRDVLDPPNQWMDEQPD